MAKTGNNSRNAARHGREGSKQWRADQLHNKHKSTTERGWEPRLVENWVDVEGLLTPPEPFKSSLEALRPHPADSWGYRFVARHLGEEIAPPAKGRKKPKKQKPKEKHNREIQPGEPLIDLGADGLELVPMGDTTVPADAFDDDEDPYSLLLDDAGRMLQQYDYLFPKEHPGQKVLDDGGTSVTGPVRTAMAREPRRPKGAGSKDNLKRMTVDVTPALSRAVEMMIADGRTDEAREILGRALPDLARDLQVIFPDAKVVACGWHVKSGQLHADFWVHSTRLETHILGLKETPTLCRIWEPDGLAHQGPGPGICAWDRHMAALGEDIEELAPARCREVREAIKRQEERAVERGRPSTANRDIAIHRRFDEVVASVLPAEYVQRGRDAYRAHLLEVYQGGDPKIAKVVADPVRHARHVKRMARVLRKTYREAQEAKKGKREAVEMVAGIEEREAKLSADRKAVEWREKAVDHSEARIAADRESVILREQAIAVVEKRLEILEAQLELRNDQVDQAKDEVDERMRKVTGREELAAASETRAARRLSDVDVRERTLGAKEKEHSLRVRQFRNRIRKSIGDLRELRALRGLGRMVTELIPMLPTEVPATSWGQKLAGIRVWMETRFGSRRGRSRHQGKKQDEPKI